MLTRTKESCPDCSAAQQRINQLETQVANLSADVRELKAELAKAKKDSTTSSKPPSSDIINQPPAKKSKRKRRQGGQPGHPRHLRSPFAEHEIDAFFDYSLDACPDCGGHIEPSTEPPRVIQQVEIVESPIRVEEHRGRAGWCSQCQKLHYAPIDEAVQKAGLVGPRLTALIAYMKGACHASFSTIRKFLRDVVGVRICRGQLAKIVHKVSDALDECYDELAGRLPGERFLNIDETGHPEQRRRMWTWCFRADLYTMFRIDPSRSSKVLLDVLGREFDGIIGCDYFSAYRKYQKEIGVELQYCLAHLIRDIKFLTTHPHRATRTYGDQLLGHLRALFGTIHRRDRFASEESFQARLTELRIAFVDDAVFLAPTTREADNLSRRLLFDAEGYFLFISHPGVEPTNNAAERAFRFVAIQRRITQGTRGETGRRWCERIWTVIATCLQQGRSAFEFVYETVRAYFGNQPVPSLAPSGRLAPDTS